MGDSAGEEQRDSGDGEVGGTLGLAEEIADMIERHEDQDDAAGEIDRFNARRSGVVGHRR